jgi:hypothetical protein
MELPMSTNETIEAIGVELEPVRDRTLFRTDDPVQVIRMAQQIAAELKGVITAGSMTQHIGRSDHVRIEGWQTLGAMLGVSAHTVWSRPCEGGWEARAEARTVNGNAVGAAEAMCTRHEPNWAEAEDYAIRSMAQTRAHAKALGAPLRFVMTLAGQSATPAEEAAEDTAAQVPEWAQPIPQTEVRPFGERLADIVGETNRDAIGEAIWRQADGIPRIVAHVITLIAGAIASPAEPTPPAGGWAPGSGLEEPQQ